MPYQNFGPQRSASGIAPKVDSLPEAATQTFLAGAPLIINAAGFIEECAAAPALIYAIAVKPGQNGATAGLYSSLFHRVGPDIEFDGTLLAAGGLTQTMIGENYGLIRGADKIWYIDPADAADQVVIKANNSRNPVGTVNPTVDFTIDAANIQTP